MWHLDPELEAGELLPGVSKGYIQCCLDWPDDGSVMPGERALPELFMYVLCLVRVYCTCIVLGTRLLIGYDWLYMAL